MTQLSGSVGRGGLNQKLDVRLVQGLLNNYKILGIANPIKIDGKAGNKTYTRIEVFQKKVLLKTKPDGRVDPNGQTFKKLTNRPNSKSAFSCTFSTKAINLLKSIEKLRTKPYDDDTSVNITQWVNRATIGYGHLISKGDWNKYKKGLTKAEALTLFNKDLAPFIKKIKHLVKTKVMQYEFDAMIILIFNIGVNGFRKSSVLKLVNNPGAKTSFTSLEKAWKIWNKTDKKYNKGLANRRKAEWNIYTKNIYRKW